MNICRICKKELIPEINWQLSRVKKKNKICRACNQKQVREWKSKHKGYMRKYHREYCLNYRHFYRDKVIAFLGSKCNNPNCPIPRDKLDIRTLQIDHINGKGNMERKSFASPYQYVRAIYKKILEGSKDYQLLCPYCNVMKRIEKKESIQPSCSDDKNYKSN